MERWAHIRNTKNQLMVSDAGRVKSFLRDKENGNVLKATPDKKGYMRLRVTIERRKMSFKLHRIVAEAFIPNPSNLKQVNHIDGNKANNCVENLEWVSNYENAHHAIEHGLWDNVTRASHKTNMARRTPVIAIDPYTGDRMHFASVSEAEQYFHTRHISDVLKGKRNMAAGYYFVRGVVQQ